MQPPPRVYHCPQCGYDLRGQTIDRCPECGFLYDLPALRDLTWQAFYAAYDPYRGAARVLAPAMVLGIAAVLAPSEVADRGFYILLLIPLGFVFLFSSRFVESWILGSLRREMRDLDWLSTSLIAVYAGMILLLRLAAALPGVVRVLAGLGIILGVSWALCGLAGASSKSLLSATPVQAAILDRARQAVWTLVAADLVILMLLFVGLW